MRALTKREKILLAVLGVALLFAGAWFLIAPEIERTQTLEEELAAVETQEFNMQQTIRLCEGDRAEVLTLNDRAAALYGAFLPVLSNDDLDRYITGMLQDNGLVAESLLISASETPAANAALQNCKVEVTASGTLERFMALSELASYTDCLRISEAVIRARANVTFEVPLSPLEYARAQAEVTVEKDEVRKKRNAAAKIPDALPYRTESEMEYLGKLTFEITEFDAAFFELLAAYAG